MSRNRWTEHLGWNRSFTLMFTLESRTHYAMLGFRVGDGFLFSISVRLRNNWISLLISFYFVENETWPICSPSVSRRPPRAMYISRGASYWSCSKLFDCFTKQFSTNWFFCRSRLIYWPYSITLEHFVNASMAWLTSHIFGQSCHCATAAVNNLNSIYLLISQRLFQVTSFTFGPPLVD